MAHTKRTKRGKKGSRGKRNYKRGKGYGKKMTKSAIPQRKNLSTVLRSQLPRVGFKTLKYKEFTMLHTITTGGGANADADKFNDAHLRDAFSCMGEPIIGNITRGSSYDNRIGSRIKIQQINLKIRFEIPSFDETLFTGSVLQGGTENIRWCLILDTQANTTILTTGTQIWKAVTGFTFPDTQYNQETRKRFKVLYDSSLSLSQFIVRSGDVNGSSVFSGRASKTFDCVFRPKTTITFDNDSSEGKAGNIWDNNIYLIWGHTNPEVEQFEQAGCLRTVKMFAQVRTSFTDL